jgi:hypothetical protein
MAAPSEIITTEVAFLALVVANPIWARQAIQVIRVTLASVPTSQEAAAVEAVEVAGGLAKAAALISMVEGAKL